MSTLKIWDLHMTSNAPMDDEFAEGTKKVAENIAEEPSVLWKIWTVDPATKRFGSTYLFRSLEELEAYKAKHIPRLAKMGVSDVQDHIFDVMEDLSKINRAPLQDPREVGVSFPEDVSGYKIWDLHLKSNSTEFAMNEEFAEGTKKVAESIAGEPGVLWKIWTMDPVTKAFGSTYLFRSLEDLETYKAKHIPRLAKMGITDVEDHVFDIMEDLSKINRAPLKDMRT